jgi:hypothetical protein
VTRQIQDLAYFNILTLFDTQDTFLSATLLTPIDADHRTACLWEIAGLCMIRNVK